MACCELFKKSIYNQMFLYIKINQTRGIIIVVYHFPGLFPTPLYSPTVGYYFAIPKHQRLSILNVFSKIESLKSKSRKFNELLFNKKRTPNSVMKFEYPLYSLGLLRLVRTSQACES